MVFCTQSTLSRFLLAWIVNYQNQTLVFDDDVTKHLSKIPASSFESRNPRSEKPSKIFFALWTQPEVAVARPEHQTTSILFILGFLPKWYFFVITHACYVFARGTASLALPGDSNCCLSSNRRAHDAWRTYRNGLCFFLFFVACNFFFACFCCSSHFHCGRPRA